MARFSRAEFLWEMKEREVVTTVRADRGRAPDVDYDGTLQLRLDRRAAALPVGGSADG
jgi:hypothetical protein